MKTKFFAVLACLTVGMIYVNDAKSIDCDMKILEEGLSYFYDMVNDCQFARTLLDNEMSIDNNEKRLKFFCSQVVDFGEYLIDNINREGVVRTLYWKNYMPDFFNIDIIDALTTGYEYLRPIRYIGNTSVSGTLGYAVTFKDYSVNMVKCLENLVLIDESQTPNGPEYKLSINQQYLIKILRAEEENRLIEYSNTSQDFAQLKQEYNMMQENMMLLSTPPSNVSINKGTCTLL